ncbi:hypothetical protein CHS0354_022637 [Potamilus streckersoni]|uniref:SOCS box domain-containing protein n=1 Tax=Potamilus streckersoni TaxID=2493646 RepID=A0AAE0TH38_9BIVA|nr:hypothetical protein CHS0354_022637 [Potamilus streckersoni]
MTRDTQEPKSFQAVDPENIAPAIKCDELRPLDHFPRAQKETWCVAWSPDCSYFAWSCGSLVQLLPWDRDNNCILRGQENETHTVQQDDLEIFNLTSLRSQLKSENEKPKTCHRRQFILDCKDYVWSLAFGTGTSAVDISLKRFFIFEKDLILATGLALGQIKLWSAYTGELLIKLIDHQNVVRDLSFAPDGSLILVSASNDYTIKFWDLNRDGNMFKTLKFMPCNAFVFSCKWSPNSKQIAAVGGNRSVFIWDVHDLNSPPRKLTGHLHTVYSCNFSPDGALLATASFDTNAIIWDPFTGDALLYLGHMSPPPHLIYAGGENGHHVRGVSFLADCLHVATVCDDGYMRYWNLHDITNPVRIAEKKNLLCCASSPNGTVVSVGTSQGEVSFYKVPHEVSSLLHLCRMIIRQNVPSTKVDRLYLPFKIKEYLKYHTI